ncbi:MAG TPA: cytochrome c oxidase, cbb3-type, CcoQ subunit [Campylobacteraceae bacterium]|jgi:cytochrome c oxidase cbb3-type subunit 4|nr:cytochrome c oxidase, cbb3-type, CcoQ subunit [Campylobacteraceae bacterium]
MDIDTVHTIQATAYVILTGICVVLLYGYIYHLYSSEKKGTRDYEKYANIALDDELGSKPLEKTSPWEKKKNKGESA